MPIRKGRLLERKKKNSTFKWLLLSVVLAVVVYKLSLCLVTILVFKKAELFAPILAAILLPFLIGAASVARQRYRNYWYRKIFSCLKLFEQNLACLKSRLANTKKFAGGLVEGSISSLTLFSFGVPMTTSISFQLSSVWNSVKELFFKIRALV